MRGKARAVWTVILVLGMVGLMFVFLPGCGENKAEMQSFADGFLGVVDYLQSQPEVGQQGQQAATTYASSGYTDLESAEKVKESYEKSVERDKEALKKLDELKKPDKEAEEIADELESGVKKVDEGNTMFTGNLARAKDQTVEERAATFQDIQPIMKLYIDGVTKIVNSVKKLEDYIKSNKLEGGTKAKEWLEKFSEELEMFKGYVTQ